MAHHLAFDGIIHAAEMKPYEVIDHTADLCVRVYGENLEALFLNAAKVMFELILEEKEETPPRKNPEYKKIVLNKSGENLDEIFIFWLTELLYLFSVESFIFGRADIQRLSSEGIQAEVEGKTFNPEFYWIKTEIKAVTYHELELKQISTGYQAQIIFDV